MKREREREETNTLQAGKSIETQMLCEKSTEPAVCVMRRNVQLDRNLRKDKCKKEIQPKPWMYTFEDHSDRFQVARPFRFR